MASPFAIAVVALSLLAASPSSADVDRRPVVWLLGDSITAAYAPVFAATNPQWQVVDLGQPLETAGEGYCRLHLLVGAPIDADDIYPMAAGAGFCDVTQWPQQPQMPDVIVVLYGANDATWAWNLDHNGAYAPFTHGRRYVTRRVVVRWLAKIVTLASRYGATTIVATPFSRRVSPGRLDPGWAARSPREFYWRYNRKLRDLVRSRFRDAYVDFRPPARDAADYFAASGNGRELVHPSPLGIRFLSAQASAATRVVLAGMRTASRP